MIVEKVRSAFHGNKIHITDRYIEVIILGMKVQFILKKYKSRYHTLTDFDIDVCSIGYDPSRQCYWYTEKYEYTTKRKTIYFDHKHYTSCYVDRIFKYMRRCSYGVYLPNVDYTKINVSMLDTLLLQHVDDVHETNISWLHQVKDTHILSNHIKIGYKLLETILKPYDQMSQLLIAYVYGNVIPNNNDLSCYEREALYSNTIEFIDAFSNIIQYNTPEEIYSDSELWY